MVDVPGGRSSAGRAPALHAGGQEFDPPRLHHTFLLCKNVSVSDQQAPVRHVCVASVRKVLGEDDPDCRGLPRKQLFTKHEKSLD